MMNEYVENRENQNIMSGDENNDGQILRTIIVHEYTSDESVSLKRTGILEEPPSYSQTFSRGNLPVPQKRSKYAPFWSLLCAIIWVIVGFVLIGISAPLKINTSSGVFPFGKQYWIYKYVDIDIYNYSISRTDCTACPQFDEYGQCVQYVRVLCYNVFVMTKYNNNTCNINNYYSYNSYNVTLEKLRNSYPIGSQLNVLVNNNNDCVTLSNWMILASLIGYLICFGIVGVAILMSFWLIGKNVWTYCTEWCRKKKVKTTSNNNENAMTTLRVENDNNFDNSPQVFETDDLTKLLPATY